MCLAIFITQDKKLSKEALQQAFLRNSDGGGFAYIEDDRVIVDKGFTDFEQMWAALDVIQSRNDLPKLVHVRRKSSGEISEENCHPFSIDDTHALIHNGTIHSFNSPQSNNSDTVRFTREMLQPMFAEHPEFYKTKYGRWFIEEAIGSFNKIIILDAKGDYVIFNESRGEWIDGIWFSNDSWKAPKKKEKKQNDYKFKRYNGKRKEKPSAYRMAFELLVTENDICLAKSEKLTQTDISKLTHYFKKIRHQKKCKLKHLIHWGIVEPVWEVVDTV